MNVSMKVLGLLAVTLLCLPACSGVEKQAPHMNFGRMGFEGDFGRDDFVVMNTVTGTSTSRRFLFVYELIDGNNVKLFGIPLNFTDKYTYFRTNEGLLDWLWELFPGTADRAYYNALAQVPDADVVLVKSLDSASQGIPGLWSQTTVTFRGKALKLKPDGSP